MNASKGFITILSVLLAWIVYYLFQPALNFFLGGGFLFISFLIIVAAANICMYASSEENDGAPFMMLIPIIILLLVIGIIIAFSGSSIFNSQKMYTQIGEIKEKSFTGDIVEIDNSQIPIVDVKLAENLADKKIGEKKALGSMVELGNFDNKQSINGKLYYVIPLEFSGFFKWYQNSAEGTPGFIMVSATNTSNAKFVQEVNGESLHLRYMENACFSQNLKRHLRSNGLRNEGLTEYTFELDDDLNPHWVVTIFKNTAGFSLPEATGVAICDPQSGKVETYSIEDTPEWVDIIQPETFIKDQLENYGEYPHGWWNPSDTDKLKITKHMTTVFFDGDCWCYTGMSSYGKDNSTVGFIMVNSRNKKTKFYKMAGATESAAMKSVQGQIQEKNYKSTVPIPINVSGIPTFFMTLKDEAGLIKKYGMVNIEDYNIVAVKDSIDKTKRAYITAVNEAG